MSKNVLINEEIYNGVSKVKLPLADSTGYAEFSETEGTLSITANGSYDVKEYANVSVLVATDGDGSIGGLTSYQTVKVTPSTSYELMIENTWNAIPKFIIITCDENSEAMTEIGFVRCGFICSKIEKGVLTGINSTTLNESSMSIAINETAGQNLKYALNESNLRIHQVNNNVIWNVNTEYTVELYF